MNKLSIIGVLAIALLLGSCSKDDDGPGGGGDTSEKKEYTCKGVTFKMVKVDGGSFMMGGTLAPDEATYHEKPVHKVTVSSYYIAETEVTQALWNAVMSTNPSEFKGDKFPVGGVSWNDCKTFISKLNTITGKNFRLPTEAEWEFAAIGGNKSKGYKYSGSANLNDVAWYDDNSGKTYHNVATKKPNELGIYDMSGNVWEWCNDRWDSNYYSVSPEVNPKGPSTGTNRVIRGGSYDLWNVASYVSRRGFGDVNYNLKSYGLRLAISE